MRRHVIDRPRYQPSGRATERFVAIERQRPGAMIFAKVRRSVPSQRRLTQFLRIARGLRA